MSKEISQEGTEEGTPSETQIQQAQVSTVEDQAREQGWVPKDDFQGDEHKWVDAGEFIRRGELFKKIDQVSRTAKTAQQTLEQFKKHYARVQEIATANAIKTLKDERKQAMVEGDFDRVEKIEDQIEVVKTDLETTKKEIETTTEVPEVHPEVQDWIAKNDWYSKDLPMKAYADTIAAQLGRQGVSGSALLKSVDQEIRKAFPAKFSNPNRERPSATEGSSTRSGRGKDSFELSDQETRIMNNLVSQKVMTKEEYIRDLKAIKGIR